jgi:hypothetical protein
MARVTARVMARVTARVTAIKVTDTAHPMDRDTDRLMAMQTGRLVSKDKKNCGRYFEFSE